MVVKLLIKEHKAHIKGYGFISDQLGKTSMGVDNELISLLQRQGAKFSEEFIQDNSIPAHEVNLPKVPHSFIPRGQLNIYAYFDNHLVAPVQGEGL